MSHIHITKATLFQAICGVRAPQVYYFCRGFEQPGHVCMQPDLLGGYAFKA